MYKNQKGFSLVESLLLFVILAIIAGVGWYVWQSKNKENDRPQTQTIVPIEAKEAKNEAPVLKQGYKLYEDSNFSLQHPDSWISSNEKDQPGWVSFKSPDYVPATELGPSVKAGYWLEVGIYNEPFDSKTFEEDLQKVKEAKEQGGCGGDYEVIKIDSHPAIQSDMKCHGTEIYARLFTNGKEYFFRLNSLDEDKPEVRELFTAILSTVDIK